MVARKDHISSAVKVEPLAIYQAIGLLSQALDVAEYHSDTVMSAYLPAATSLPEQAYAWMLTAMLIADVAEVDGQTLRSLQAQIYRGSQNALF